ncbi:Laminin EGF domain [Popillia japonica]|uniref:Delta-like protein n=1 Tax=Popillia japonica TaxID=7064 RepID=A0AAW1MGH4_POPJA
MTLFYISLLVILSAECRVHALYGSLQSICFKIERQYKEIIIAPGQTQKVIDWVSTDECCNGYREIDDYCEPQCDIPCGEHGKCIEPNVCVCDNNYTGSNCDTVLCPPGYTGTDCENGCTENTFGRNCEEECTCQNGRCDPISGRCDCYDGWSGPECSIPCPEGVSCVNGGICTIKNDSSSTCTCPAGYIGQKCENICPKSYWGEDCLEICYCEDDHFFHCNHVNGTCESKCENGEYFDETCWCDNGWDGEFCTEKVCPEGYYGKDCEQKCRCQMDTTKSCDRETGACTCHPGWIGDFCREACPNMSFGIGCNKSCICEDGNVKGCNPVTGECKCERGWTGYACNRPCSCVNGYCDNHGNCICDAGWQGRTCNRECDAGYFGEGCSNFCGFLKEETNIICDRFAGPECAPGFMGAECTEPCPKGRYGRNCDKFCSCSPSKICNRVTGDCECSPGVYGEKCEKTCPNGTFGLSCSGTCWCPNCNVVNGDCTDRTQSSLKNGGCNAFFSSFSIVNEIIKRFLNMVE